MLLDRVDIDSHGPLTRVGLGPFSQQLNAIFAPAGAGKTALVRFLRDSLTGTTPAYQGMARSSGRVVWAAADGLYHCRREPNGTAEGRRFVEFESRLASQSQNRWDRPSLVVDLPASIVDGIVTDTTVTSPRRIVEAVLRSGLDRSGATAAAEQARQHEIASLRRELERLRGLLPQDLDHGSAQHESRIRDRLAALTLELGAIDSRREFARQTEAALQRARRDREAMSQAVAEVDRLRAQETELRSRLDTLDRTLCRLQEQSKQDEHRIALTERTRTRVHWLNQQIERVRCLLGEVRELGDQWFGDRASTEPHTSAHPGHASPPGHAYPRVFDARRAFDSSPAFDSLVDRGPADRPATPLSRSELQLTDRGWSRPSPGEPQGSGLDSRPAIGQRLDAACQLVDHLIGRLDAEQEHWLRLEYPLTERFHEQVSESEQALERLRDRASTSGASPGDRAAAEFHQHLLADPGWVDDPLRRRRIDALRRAEQRRRLDEAADQEVIDGQPEDALLVTLRTIGEALHSVARRLRGLRGQWQCQAPGHAFWGESLDEAAWQLNSSAAPSSVPALPLAEQVDALRRCERDLVLTLERLAQHRVALLRRVAQAQRLPESLLDAMIADASLLPSAVDQWLVTSLTDGEETALDQRNGTERHGAELHGAQGDAGGTAGAESRLAQQQRLAGQRRQLAQELEQTIQRIDARLADAERLRAGLKQLPLPNVDSDQAQRERIEAEIQHLHRLLAAPAASSAAQRYRQCELRLQTLQAEQAAATSLATAASECLQRLSGGRLSSVTWRSQIDPASGRPFVEVLIDAQPERNRSDWDRSLAALAIRMAAADELSRRARPLPLVIEMPQHLGVAPQTLATTAAIAFDRSSATGTAASQDFVAALADTARRGRQIILLSDSRSLIDAATELGGCGFDLRRSGEVSRFSVPHSPHVRPGESEAAWTSAAAPQFAAVAQEPAAHDHRVAPAAAAAPVAAAVFDRPVGHDAVRYDDASAGHQPLTNHRTAKPQPLPLTHPSAPTAANRNQPKRARHEHDLPQHDLAARELPEQRQEVVSFPIHDPAVRNGRGGGERSPFFLTAESAIEQAPSIDVMAAIRLRELGIQTVAQLLACSPQELAQQIKLVDVDAATVRRWRNECRLVCGVAGLRGFDARVLVGCGMTHPQELAEIHPAELVEKVEAFLATPRGVQILRTGTSHEVSRLTGWIAEARQSSRSGPSVVTGKTLRASGRPADGTPRQREREEHETAAKPVHSQRQPALKFYLHRQSPIVDAPSIGPRMAERLAKLQITTVDDLLAAKPAEVAAALKLRRVDAAVVRAWQQQIQLVCRVPLLRGHDAQLLVAAGIHEPERLAQCDPSWLLSQINPISRSREGQRILRGSQSPDLAEVTQWVCWAQQHRELQAA